MKCPEWLLEAMRKGEGVKCLVSGGSSGEKEHDVITGFDSAEHTQYPFYATGAVWYEHAEPYTEPVHGFKPFEQVLVRDGDDTEWRADFYSHNDNTRDHRDYPFVCIGNYYRHCIPYAGNEHLLGTTDSPKN